MSSAEQFFECAHAARPGMTSGVFERTRSYARLAAAVADHPRVLDLACGDGPLLAMLPDAIGLDRSAAELQRATRLGRGAGRVVQGRAQSLPFAAGSFDACACHLALMLFDDLDLVTAELDRVLAPGGVVAAMLGGGPTASPACEPAIQSASSRRRGGRARGSRVVAGPVTGIAGSSSVAKPDAFHRFLELAQPHFSARAFGDARARSEAGWRALWPTWEVAPFERIEHDLSGSFVEIWAFLGSSYQLPAAAAEPVRTALHAELGDLDVRLRVVTYLAVARKPGPR